MGKVKTPASTRYAASILKNMQVRTDIWTFDSVLHSDS